MGDFHLKGIDIIGILDVVFNDLEIWLKGNFISNHHNI